jgi:hypothetical protein
MSPIKQTIAIFVADLHHGEKPQEANIVYPKGSFRHKRFLSALCRSFHTFTLMIFFLVYSDCTCLNYTPSKIKR